MTVEREALARQSARLAPLRERLLRRVLPASRGATLDLACGFGALTGDLLGRVRGPVTAVDCEDAALRHADPRAFRVRADAAALPFRDATFDLVVTQAAWLWFPDLDAVAREVHRVPAPGGALVAAGEPDFGGAIEHPPEVALAPLWEAALRRAGADPRVGRELPGVLRRAGFERLSCEVFGEIAPPGEAAALRDDEAMLLRGLLRPDEETALERARQALAHASDETLVFVPRMGLLAFRSDSR